MQRRVLEKLVTFSFFFENIQKHHFFDKIDWSMNLDGNGQGIARDIKKNYLPFQNATKKGNKVWKI